MKKKTIAKLGKTGTFDQATLYYWSIWLVIGVCHYLILNNMFYIPVYESLIDSFSYNLVLAFLGRYLGFQIKFLSIERFKIVNLVMIHVAAGLIFSVIWAYGVNYLILYLFEVFDDYVFFLEKTTSFRTIIGFLIYMMMITLNYLWHYYMEWKLNQERESNLSSMLKDAELKALKYQINPHFIFNSLNSIASLCYTHSQKAADMTVKLAEFLRSTFKRNEEQKVTLEEELEAVIQYIQIEKTRYSDRLSYEINVGKSCKKIMVPTMILQPLIENAIKHGVHESTETIQLTIDCKEKTNHMELRVHNTYDSTAIVPKAGEGLGLTATKERLYKTYAQENLLSIKKTKDEFEIRIRIPHAETQDES